MDTESIYNLMESKYQDALDQVFGKDDKHPNAGFKDSWGEKTGSSSLAALDVLALLFVPFVLESEGEKSLDTPAPPQPPEIVVDSGGNQIGTVKQNA
jgi:hypothetical protein